MNANNANDVYEEKVKNIPLGLNYQEYNELLNLYSEELMEVSRAYRLVKTPDYNDIPDYGDIMSLEDFVDNCNEGGFIDYDGSGSYIKDGKESNITILPSDVKHNSIRKDFTEIVWYNK